MLFAYLRGWQLGGELMGTVKEGWSWKHRYVPFVAPDAKSVGNPRQQESEAEQRVWRDGQESRAA